MTCAPEKKTYAMISFDMDGTLLNSAKEISPGTLAALRRAAAEGKEIVISTGRSLAEMMDYLKQLPYLHWLICTSGACVLKLSQRDGMICTDTVASYPIPPETVIQSMEIASEEDPMMHLLGLECLVQRDQECHMADYGMGGYQGLFDRVSTSVEDLKSFYRENPFTVYKVNFYHRSPESRRRTRERLFELGSLVMVDAESSSLECSLKGVSKAAGLRDLCRYTGIGLDRVIAVGDADNDLDILKSAGLAIAMGNANEHVMTVCNAVVSDCDHDGCAEAVCRYLLGGDCPKT